MSHGTTSARLGGARADFVGGLGRKVADLRATLARVRALPQDLLVRDELRRKLHALSSAAKMMKFDAMDRALAEALGILDRSSRELPLEDIDVDAIEQTIEDLPALAWGDGHARSSQIACPSAKVAGPTYRVLVVGTPLIAEALLEPDEAATATFTCESTPDPQAAFELVKRNEPDLVVLDGDLSAATELVEALMDDPLTETVPVVVVGSFLEAGEAARYVALGVAKTVSKPTSREVIRAVCEETLLPVRKVLAIESALGEPTLEELGERLAAEIRDALVGRADPSARTRRIALGQGSEVLGAVWGAIARVREIVVARSDGQVRFGGGPEGALTPAQLLHEPDVARADRQRLPRRGPAADVRLAGRRVVVADDDPAVVWFLADLLKTTGCVVREAFDGQQALELCYETSPDLVISDILMPKLDGFSLCRALRRDVALRDTPVILLSWKEDLLQRVRELGAGAAGYVRKESDTRAIIARVREALRTRGRVEARLREDGEVRGRLDGVSVRTLLEIVCATRPDARVSVRDANFLYEVEIRAGAPLRATRTDGGGRFLKGTKVLAQLLGVSAGRFTVATSLTPVEAELDGNLASQLAKPIARARAATAILTGAGMHAVARVRLDEEHLDDYLEATPERARLVARRLANGASPRDLVLCGGCEPALLDDLLCDLSARGLVVGVEDAGGEDMLRPGVKGLLAHADTRAELAPRTVTPPPATSVAEAEVEGPAPFSCANDAAAPMCASPVPGDAASLADAVLREMTHPSPEPTDAIAESARREDDAHAEEPRPLDTSNDDAPEERSDTASDPSVPISVSAPAAVAIVTVRPAEVAPAAQGAPEIDAALHGTPLPVPSDAHVERTAVDGTEYGPNDPASALEVPRVAERLDDDPDLADLALDERYALTPFASVSSSEDETKEATKKKRWPMIAFVAAAGMIGWAVLYFSTRPTALEPEHGRQIRAPEPEIQLAVPASTAAEAEAKPGADVVYTPVAVGTVLPAEHGVLRVTAPEGAVVVVDGKARAHGSTAMPMPSGKHEVRVRLPSDDERGCTIGVRSSRVAHIAF